MYFLSRCSFNRYMVECEFKLPPIKLVTHCGFNRYMVECEFARGLLSEGATDGFNRYMVECEFFINSPSIVAKSVLIDTWWNVNDGNTMFSDFL